MMYRAAICDDNETDLNFVKNILLTYTKQQKLNIKIEQFTSAESFLFRYAEEKSFDILLLDIEMGSMDGIALAKKLRQDNAGLQIVFITGYADYMAEGYDVSALHYLMKPVNKEKLFSVLDRAVSGIQRSSRVVLLPVDGEMLRLPVEQIQFVEAFSHSVTITTEKTFYEVKISLVEMEKQLGEGFVRCHRSYLVGIKFIARLSKNEVFMDNGKILPMSRSAAPFVHKAFVAYYTGEENETI